MPWVLGVSLFHISYYNQIRKKRKNTYLMFRCSKNCPCATGSTEASYTQYINEMNTAAYELASLGRFRNSNTFAVVVQPFMQRQGPPMNV
jgi:hypothetical protein